jgi:hypothetical protein
MKTHFTLTGYSAVCGAYNVLSTYRTANPNDVTCLSCRKNKVWKEAMKKYNENHITADKTIQISYKINKPVAIEDYVSLDEVDEILATGMQALKSLPDGRILLIDEDNDNDFFLLTLTINKLEMEG